MLRFAFYGFLLVALGVGTAQAADHYSVSLTRKDKNFYRVDGTHFWVQTRYCYTIWLWRKGRA